METMRALVGVGALIFALTAGLGVTGLIVASALAVGLPLVRGAAALRGQLRHAPVRAID